MQLQSSARRAAWNDPVRKLRTLESFARTEADGGRDLLAAAARVGDPELRRSLELHARDELRHAELFQRRADELRPLVAPLAAAPEGSDRAYDLSRGRPKGEVDLHGFFSESLCDELGEVAYVAMLHVAERRAQALFERQRALVSDDPELQAAFAEILQDEKFHVRYTASWLERWRKAGRSQEVSAGLRAARGSRLLGGWKRFGARSAASFGRNVLFLMYATVLVPFALGARRGRERKGWRERSMTAASTLERARSQYG
jgi:rubrerythrin